MIKAIIPMTAALSAHGPVMQYCLVFTTDLSIPDEVAGRQVNVLVGIRLGANAFESRDPSRFRLIDIGG